MYESGKDGGVARMCWYHKERYLSFHSVNRDRGSWNNDRL